MNKRIVILAVLVVLAWFVAAEQYETIDIEQEKARVFSWLMPRPTMWFLIYILLIFVMIVEFVLLLPLPDVIKKFFVKVLMHKKVKLGLKIFAGYSACFLLLSIMNQNEYYGTKTVHHVIEYHKAQRNTYLTSFTTVSVIFVIQIVNLLNQFYKKQQALKDLKKSE